MKRALIFYRDLLAGKLSESDEGYVFQYDEDYLSRPDAEPISLTLPLRSDAYQSPVLFPFFDGLIPEGWLWLVQPPFLNMRKDLLVDGAKEGLASEVA